MATGGGVASNESSTVFPEKTTTVHSQDMSTTLSPEAIRIEYYKTYDPMTGVRIAATLGGFICFFCIFLLYKTKCKPQRDYDKAPVEDPSAPPLFQVSVLAEESKGHEDGGYFPPVGGSPSLSQQDPCAPSQGFHSSYARFHAHLDEAGMCISDAIDDRRDSSDRNSGGDSPLIGAVGITHNFNTPPTKETALSPDEDSPSPCHRARGYRNGAYYRSRGNSSYDRRNHIRSYSPEMEIGEPSGIGGALLAIDADDELSEWDNHPPTLRTLMDQQQPTCSWHTKHLLASDDSSSDCVQDSDSSAGETLLFLRPHVDRSSDITPEVSETKC